MRADLTTHHDYSAASCALIAAMALLAGCAEPKPRPTLETMICQVFDEKTPRGRVVLIVTAPHVTQSRLLNDQELSTVSYAGPKVDAAVTVWAPGLPDYRCDWAESPAVPQ